MHVWRAHLLASWKLVVDNDEEDEFNLNLVFDIVVGYGVLSRRVIG
jgi:hypothetical protein